MHDTITLPNGVRLLTQAVPNVRTAALGVFVGTGSRHERAGESGAAHFLEHMTFKSTRTRSTAALARQIDALGGHVNAYTTKESTCFYLRCLDDHLPIAAEMLCDMLLDGAFSDDEVTAERSVISEEIGMYRDTPEDLAAERLAAAVWRGSSLARPILGTPGSLAKMDGAWLRAYHRSHYCPDRIVVSLAGRYDSKTVDLLTSRFSALPPGAAQCVTSARFHRAVSVKHKATEQDHLILAFPALPYTDERRYAQQLLSSILGGGVSSRLFQQVREEQGLCYNIYSYISDYADTGFLGLYAAVSPHVRASALDAVCRVTAELAEHGVTQQELDGAREQAKAGLLMAMESAQARMSHAGTSLLLRGRVLTPEQILDSYEAVTAGQLRQLAAELLDFSRCSLSAVGRVHSPDDLRHPLLSF